MVGGTAAPADTTALLAGAPAPQAATGPTGTTASQEPAASSAAAGASAAPASPAAATPAAPAGPTTAALPTSPQAAPDAAPDAGLATGPATPLATALTPAALTDPTAVTTTAPDAVELTVPADVSGGDPVPALDVRSTASPAAPAAAAQTAGTAVVDAMLPAEVAPTSAPADTDTALPDTALPDTAQPDTAPGGTASATSAAAGVTGAPAADLRPSLPAAPAAAAPPPPPAAQVVQLLAPVLAGPDGTYSLSLQLYPEELGAVQVDVLLRGGEIRLALHAPDDAAQAALRSALPDLRADLLAGGLSATSLSVDDGRSGSASDRSDRWAERRPDGQSSGHGDPSGRRPHPYRNADPGVRQPPSHTDAALDLRM